MNIVLRLAQAVLPGRRAGKFLRGKHRVVCALGIGMWIVHDASAAIVEPGPLEFYVADELSYDDNLFRVPDGMVASDLPALTVKSLDDYSNRASAGVHAHWDTGRQVIGIHLRVDDVRFNNNDDLNYTDGNGSVAWDWQAGKRWSGVFNAQYDRSMASFSNYRFFTQDLVDIFSYWAEARYRIGSRWRLLGAGSNSKTEHSAEARRFENFDSQTRRAGLEYHTPSDNVMALEYRYTDADFQGVDGLSGDFTRRYRERVPGVRATYAFTGKTTFDGRFGYLERDYANPVAADLAGDIWNASLRWEPTAKTSFDFKWWHELKAYSDAESQYFVANGGSIGPTWAPTFKLALSLLLSLEDQNYVMAGVLLPDPVPRRRDRVEAAQISIDSLLSRSVTFKLLYRWVDHQSNRDLLSYRENLVSAQVQIAL
jgi:hypothetical protein